MREAALLELALVNYAMAAVVRYDFVPVITPALVRERTMEEAGFFPTDRAQVYDVDEGELFLLGTSEVALSALHRAETLATADLPARYAGYSTCFRREAGTYGKDTRGIFRVHQFDKVEMFSYCAPEESGDEHERILAIEEEIVGGLGLPYRVVNIAAGDLGPAAAKKYDIEAWLPSEGRYRELTSCSNYTDYSARRLGTRGEARVGERARAHVERHRVRDQSHARVPVRALPRSRRRLRGARCTAGLRRFRRRRAALIALSTLLGGGMPERPNGAVLKTVVRKHPGFESLSLRHGFDTGRDAATGARLRCTDPGRATHCARHARVHSSCAPIT